MTLTVLILAVTLIIATGEFLDRFHISSSTRDSVRSYLVRGFIFLQNHQVTDIGHFLLASVIDWSEQYARWLVPVYLFAGYVLMGLIGWFIYGDEESITDFVLALFKGNLSDYVMISKWVIAGAVMSATIINILAWFAFRLILKSNSKLRASAVLLASPILIYCAFGLFSAVTYEVLVFLEEDVMQMIIFVYGGLIAAAPALFIFLGYIALTVIKFLLAATRKLLMALFEAASTPTDSPFRYATGLLSIALITIKIADEVF